MDEIQYQLKPFIWSSHAVIARMLSGGPVDSILDVGSSRGFLGYSLDYKPKNLCAIDKADSPLPDIYSHFWREDLDSTEFSFMGDMTFKAIVLADVIEHLKYPDQVVSDLKKYLDKDGFFIFSVPNMGFFLVRILSFLGVRPKMERGLYDKTHVHDFDLKKVKYFLRNLGLEVLEFKATPVPLPILSKMFTPGSLLFFVYRGLNFMAQKFPSFFAYQLVFKVQINET